ncbi:protein-methionine-sulfoxide reductase catalytic subunit MsrP [Pseudoprimorskyibacter insulae]|uniref:Protein-methionine-sulfoxide reductase catalytic subunit MsrP n=1 Tax=Pseudoprimorskyibacter insulae TaxID=1695997 RepID=A0A2R8AYX5_9RHOB|nr:protein-methionine-sulfoxide reductase catalytic subunit MsrP [Pseudoprimorskyibacter insulae]SPF81245.1 Protein-methionine-sulfoxide reductase catalytic subunit MsrP [Pseudoprimorskyibacter insulae]
MAHRWKNDLTETDVTPERLFLNRRAVIAGLAAGAIGGVGSVQAAGSDDLEPNDWDEITQYCNYYEFGTSKTDPARNAHTLTTKPWSIKIDGMVDKPGTYDLAELTQSMTTERRLYRFRCVEAWSMVVPWDGFELADLLNMVGVKSGAKYVAFETVLRPEEMPGVSRRVLNWPYREGLRLDEAMHPLTIMATGIYGKPMPNQNGAPIRLVVPWKYGFKSIKSIVRITLTDKQPFASWNDANPREYGFYSNVNPTVDHPRWSQASERRIGGSLLARKIPTQMFNGYEAEVASLYKGMDLKANF